MILASHGIIGSQIAQFVGLLDTYSGAAAAYSLRRLSSSYTGSAIRVRRAVGSPSEKDIGFVGENLDVADLQTFCSSTNGFVVTWYDQSGNARNITQGTALRQPQIVSSGSLIELNGKPSVLWLTGDGAMSLDFSLFPGANSYTISSVFSAIEATQYTKLLSIGPDAITSGVWYTINAGNTALEWQDNDTGFAGNGYANLSGPMVIGDSRIIPNSITTPNLLTTVLSASNAKMFKNGSEISYRVQRTGNCYTTTGALIVGNSPNNANRMQGRLQELIIWQSDENANIGGINTNINTFYSIY